MYNIETEMVYLKKELEKQSKKIDALPTRDEMSLENRKLVEEIFEKADKKYATKVAEKLIYGIAGVMLLFVVNALLELI